MEYAEGVIDSIKKFLRLKKNSAKPIPELTSEPPLKPLAGITKHSENTFWR